MPRSSAKDDQHENYMSTPYRKDAKHKQKSKDARRTTRRLARMQETQESNPAPSRETYAGLAFTSAMIARGLVDVRALDPVDRLLVIALSEALSRNLVDREALFSLFERTPRQI